VHVDVLVNAAAGSVGDGDQADDHDARLVDAFDAAGVRAVVHRVPPAELGDAVRERWAASPQPRAVVVAGGDGTVNAVVGAAADAGAVLGVLPLGTFNHFAKDLGLPQGIEEAAAALAGGEVVDIDLGEVNGRCFANNAVLGAYPEVVAERDQLRDRRGWGKVRALPVAMVAVLRRFPVHRLDLAGPGYRRRRVRTTLLFVGNGLFDNPAGGVPRRAVLTDGVLGVAMARSSTRWGLVRTVWRAVRRGAEAEPQLDLVELPELTASMRTRRIRVALDGEVCWMEPPLRFRVRPAALRVLAPRPDEASG
jgi:diacylglycerol kinase family enzyme